MRALALLLLCTTAVLADDYAGLLRRIVKNDGVDYATLSDERAALLILECCHGGLCPEWTGSVDPVSFERIRMVGSTQPDLKKWLVKPKPWEPPREYKRAPRKAS